jgi:uncharacterized protein YfbU (UPF0304 family)
VILTEPEKLMLVMLADIHEHLGVKDGSVDGAFVRAAIAGGQSWALSREYRGHAYASEDKSRAEVDEVYDVLDMWSFLEQGYAALDAADKARVDKVNFGPLSIPGFDGHEDQIYIAEFIVERMNGFQSLKDRATRDCHSPVKARYAAMVSAFEPLRAQLGSGGRHELTADEIIKIVKAGHLGVRSGAL